VRIVLSDQWLRRGIAEGVGRYEYIRRRKVKGYLGLDADVPDNELLDRYVYAAIAEICVCKLTKWRWRSQVGILTGPDVGESIEVRCRPYREDMLDIGIRKTDAERKPLHPFVLVHRHAENDNEIVGWVLGCNAEHLGAWNETRQCWFVPPAHLCDLESLVMNWGYHEDSRRVDRKER
jgi:hypothetical protein